MASSFPLLPGFAPTQDIDVKLVKILAFELQTGVCAEARTESRLRINNNSRNRK